MFVFLGRGEGWHRGRCLSELSAWVLRILKGRSVVFWLWVGWDVLPHQAIRFNLSIRQLVCIFWRLPCCTSQLILLLIGYFPICWGYLQFFYSAIFIFWLSSCFRLVTSRQTTAEEFWILWFRNLPIFYWVVEAQQCPSICFLFLQ